VVVEAGEASTAAEVPSPASPAAPPVRLPAGGEPDADLTGRRPALDGLRAVAVLLVVAYHYGSPSCRLLLGGFIGVDVFFVLSGHLITAILLGSLRRTRRLDLAGFWYRRLRRLLPPLLPLLLLTTAAVRWTMPPQTWLPHRADVLWALLGAAARVTDLAEAASGLASRSEARRCGP
jgi:peptidoglycan/LPS O-acetylase OafA/YrhL